MSINAKRKPSEITISLSLEKSGKTLIEQKKMTIPIEQIETNCTEMKKLFDSHSINHSDNKLKKLKTMGKKLVDDLLPQKIQTDLATSSATHLILELDAPLIQIPWELMSINDELLGNHFSVGRKIKTTSETSGKKMGEWNNNSLNMWIIADPAGDLSEASNEASWLCDDMDSWIQKGLNINCSSDSDVSAMEISERISEKNPEKKLKIIHFAGHSHLKNTEPEESGWKLKNEIYTARDVTKLSSDSDMPLLIVSNACNSAVIEKWEWQDNEKATNPMSLPSAFISAGVLHFVGTNWKIKDNSGILFSQSFYKHLFSGKPIGTALQLARKDMCKKAPVCSASYVLYGPPEICYVKENKLKLYYPEQTTVQENILTLSIQIEQVIEEGHDITREEVYKKKASNENSTGLNIIDHPFMLSGFILILVLMGTAIYTLITNVHQKNCFEENARIEAKIDKVLKEIATLKQQQIVSSKSPSSAINDHWTSPPICIGVVMSDTLRCFSDENLETIAVSIESQIQNKTYFTTIERLKPENFLFLIETYKQSLVISNKKLPDLHIPDLSLRVGLKDTDEGYLIQMGLIELTGKTKRFQAPYQKGSIFSQVENFTKQMIEFIQSTYPLRAIIIDKYSSNIILNIGKDHNLFKNQIFQTINTNSLMSVSRVSPFTCTCKPLNDSHDLQKGMKVIWKPNQSEKELK
jgi:CHAT domain-containing protein